MGGAHAHQAGTVLQETGGLNAWTPGVSGRVGRGGDEDHTLSSWSCSVLHLCRVHQATATFTFQTVSSLKEEADELNG